MTAASRQLPAAIDVSRFGLALVLASIGVLALVMLAFAVGHYPITAGDLSAAVWARLTGAPADRDTATIQSIVFSVRGPRILAALAIGAALAAAGAAYQSLFRNPLVSPDILGVSSGAALGAVIGIFFSLPVIAIQMLAFGLGLAAVALVYMVANAVRGHDPVLVLVLAGVVIGSLLAACVALLKYLADPYNQLPAITFWLLGSLSAADAVDVRYLLPLVIVGLVPLVLLRWRVSVLTVGDEEARALGVSAAPVRFVVIAAATLVTAASVAVCGVVGWVGLVIPHFARMLAGPQFSRLLPVSILLGGAFLLAVDTLARTAAPIEIPLGVLTAFIGTPLFLWQLTRSRELWR